MKETEKSDVTWHLAELFFFVEQPRVEFFIFGFRIEIGFWKEPNAKER